MSRRRSTLTLDWDDSDDAPLLRDLSQYRARARGRRIRELARIGLEAEKLGGVSPAAAASISQAARIETATRSRDSAVTAPAPELADDHAAGLHGFLEAFR